MKTNGVRPCAQGYAVTYDTEQSVAHFDEHRKKGDPPVITVKVCRTCDHIPCNDKSSGEIGCSSSRVLVFLDGRWGTDP